MTPAVHPRARGEQLVVVVVVVVVHGSSPRTRGTALDRPARLASSRFIPAHAGNRKSSRPARPANPVHPRARGEQSAMIIAADKFAGSSPRTRGTVFEPTGDEVIKRFIPAHAGNSRARKCERLNLPVHPRARGEQSTAYTCGGLYRGSSPRTRGTGSARHAVRKRRRFIPAHAGNSWSCGMKRRVASVHPRARGEQLTVFSTSPSTLGSSPRTRGTDIPRRHRRPELRFIPAHAGNSFRPVESGIHCPVHPRARGEQIR